MHRHSCDYAGHYWQCEGTALRPDAGDTRPSVCMCMTCKIRMEEGDHSECSVELLVCPEHQQDALTRATESKKPDRLGDELVPETDRETMQKLSLPPDCDKKSASALKRLEKYAAACLWCSHGYEEYSPKLEDEHFAYHCTDAPEKLKANARSRLKRSASGRETRPLKSSRM
jgi:hypothetical protein